MAQKPALGKGLASLFPGAVTPPPAPAAQAPAGAEVAGPPTTVQQQEYNNRDRHPGISIAGIDEIAANQYQPRRDFDDETLEELAQSIRANGIIQPLVVRKGPHGYQLIAGERRLRAAKLAGFKQVPIVIRKSTDREALELALIENIQRQNLNCIDEALAYFQLAQDFSLTQEEIAKQVGKDRATVANYLRLLRLPEAVIADLKIQKLSFGHGKALLGAENQELCLRAHAQILDRALNVRDSEALVQEMNEMAKSPQGDDSQNAAEVRDNPILSRLATIANDLTRKWSTKIELKGSERRGKIVVHYKTRDELERILGAMQNEGVWGGR